MSPYKIIFNFRAALLRRIRRIEVKGLILILSLIYTCSGSSLFAGELIGKFAFKKRAPSAALIYFSEDHGAKQNITVDQKNTRFTQKIVVGGKGNQVVFKNSDSINHNIYANDKDLKINFDIGLAPPGSNFERKITWEEGSLLRLSCKIHAKMRSWVASVSSRYFKVIKFKRKKKKAVFKLEGVPDNLHQVKVWISGYEPVEITLKKGTPVKIPLVKKRKKRGVLLLSLK